MKVLQINSVCGIRSTGRICTDIAGVLAQDGHDCRIGYGREDVPDSFRKYAVRIGSDAGVKLHALQTRIFDRTGFGSERATERFLAWVREYDPDVIHLHNIHGYYINIEALFGYLKDAGKPVIWTLHDCWAFTGHCAYFDFAGCDRWKGGCYSCPQKREYPASLLADRSEKNYRDKQKLFTAVKDMTVVTPSKWLAAAAGESYLGKYPIRVIYNGIDTEVFKPTKGDFRTRYGLENKRLILGVASVWGRRKGFDDFVKLSERLDDAYRIVLAGVSDKQKQGLPSNIIGLTRTDDTKELAELYSTADVFVNPTYEDNYPTVNLEAQACGTPVITYAAGGSPEGLSAGCGAVVSKGDLNGLQEQIRKADRLKVSDSRRFDKYDRYREYLKLYTERCRCKRL